MQEVTISFNTKILSPTKKFIDYSIVATVTKDNQVKTICATETATKKHVTSQHLLRDFRADAIRFAARQF